MYSLKLGVLGGKILNDLLAVTEESRLIAGKLKHRTSRVIRDICGGRLWLPPMTIVLLLAFSLGANGLNTDPFWTDEMFAVANMGGFDPPRGPLAIIDSVSSHFPDHVPLFFLMGAAWAQVAGWTQFALRALPVLAGLLLIAWIYRLGRDLLNPAAGMVAAILLSSSAYVILYIHDFRMYSLFLLFAAMHSWLYWRLLSRASTGRALWIGFVLSALLLLYVHLFSLIYFAGIGVYHLLCARRSRRFTGLLMCWGIAGALFLPYLPVLIAGIRRALSLETVTEQAATPIELLPTLLWLLTNGSWLLVPLILAAMILAIRRRPHANALQLLIIPAVMLSLILLVNALIGLIPIDRMRYFLILWLPFVLLVAGILTPRGRLNWLGALILALWIAAGVQFYRSQEIRQHIGGMSKQFLYPPVQDWAFRLQGKTRSLDYLLGFSDSDHINVDLDLGFSTADYYTHIYLGIDGAFIQRRGWGDWLETNIRRNMSDEPYLLFLYNPADQPPTFDNIHGKIQDRFLPCEVVLDQPDLLAQRWVHPLSACDHDYLPIAYENGIRILDRFGAYDEEASLVRLVIGWELADEAQLRQYNVSLQILDADWEKRAQMDRHFHSAMIKWDQVELSTSMLPPADYRLAVIVYDRVTGEKVAGRDLKSGESGGILPLLSFSKR